MHALASFAAGIAGSASCYSRQVLKYKHCNFMVSAASKLPDKQGCTSARAWRRTICRPYLNCYPLTLDAAALVLPFVGSSLFSAHARFPSLADHRMCMPEIGLGSAGTAGVHSCRSMGRYILLMLAIRTSWPALLGIEQSNMNALGTIQ